MALTAFQTFMPKFSQFLDLLVLEGAFSSPVPQRFTDNLAAAGVVTAFDYCAYFISHFMRQGYAEFFDAGHEIPRLIRVGKIATK